MTATREKYFILVLACFAAVHVFLFSAAFPFFGVVDEQHHLDLAIRYSHADIPRTISTPDEESLPYLVLFGTLEYIWPPASLPGGVIPPPLWKQPMDSVRPQLLHDEDLYRQKFYNIEDSQPPLYYTLAGVWWRLGKAIGFYDAQQLYWMRFLNLPVIFALVWLAWLTTRRIFPENLFLRITVPALVTFMPQTMFYFVSNDILTPLTFGLLFLLLLRFLAADQPSPRLAAGLGLAFAASYLTKTSNLPILAVATLFIAAKLVLLLRQRKTVLTTAGIFAACAIPSIAAWMYWCKTNFGDLTGSAVKAQSLHWTDKPFAQWWHHPIFTPGGFWTFLSGNLATLWQGECLWHGNPFALPVANYFYICFSFTMLLVALITFIRRPPTLSVIQQTALAFSFACLLALFAFFMLLSIKYDFHDCFYPSQDHPYFTSGRLMLGALIPILLLCAIALDRLLVKVPLKFKFLALAMLLFTMFTFETTLTAQIFPNPYNWYHL